MFLEYFTAAHTYPIPRPAKWTAYVFPFLREKGACWAFVLQRLPEKAWEDGCVSGKDQCCSQDQAIRDQDQDHTPRDQDQDQDREVQDQEQKSETKTSNFRDQDQRLLNWH